jgi:hypothetical protein
MKQGDRMRSRYAKCVCASCMSRRGYIAPHMALLLVVGFFLIAIFNVFHRSRIATGQVIANDVVELAKIFKTIDTACTIIDISQSKANINMLTIKKGGFVGSEIGSINLANPDKWEGPYVKENPTVQGKEYQIISTPRGFFIAPGDGVVLPNGKEIGKDIILDKQADIEAMLHNENQLMFQGRPLALSIRDAITTPSIEPPSPELLEFEDLDVDY